MNRRHCSPLFTARNIWDELAILGLVKCGAQIWLGCQLHLVEKMSHFLDSIGQCDTAHSVLLQDECDLTDNTGVQL